MDLISFINSLDAMSPQMLWLHTSLTSNNGALNGIARTLRHEYPLWTVIAVEFLADWNTQQQTDFIERKIATVVLPEQEIQVAADGAIKVSRLIAVNDLNTSQQWNGNPVAFNAEKEIWSHYPPPVGVEDVEVKVLAVKLSRGKADPIGFAGIVQHRGLNADIPAETRVVGLARGKLLSNLFVCNYMEVARIPEEHSIASATNIICPIFKCFYTLDLMSRMHQMSNSKRAIIHISKTEVLWPLVLSKILIGRDWQILIALHDRLEISPDAVAPGSLCNVHNSRQFVRDVTLWTGGVGADYIFSAEGGEPEFLDVNLKVLNKFGCLTVAVADNCEIPRVADSQRFIKLASSFNMEGFPFTIPAAVNEFMHLLPPDLARFGVVSLPEYLGGWPAADRDDMVLEIGDLLGNPSVIRPEFIQGASSFRPRAAYVLIGGVGGLGVSLAQFIVKNGGRRVIITSRNGLKGFEGASREQLDIIFISH